VYTKINKFKNVLIAQFKKKGILSFLSIGLLNGLLPCAMVYIALAGAIKTGSYLDGAFFMLFFGVGTLPLMFSVSIFANAINSTWRLRFQKLIPVMMLVLGVLFVLRGMNLDIHYLSPELGRVELDATQCE